MGLTSLTSPANGDDDTHIRPMLRWVTIVGNLRRYVERPQLADPGPMLTSVADPNRPLDRPIAADRMRMLTLLRHHFVTRAVTNGA